LRNAPKEADPVDAILAVPALVDEVVAAYPAIMASVAPGGDRSVRGVVMRRYAIYPQPDRSDAEEAAFQADYFDALSDLPAEALEAGMRAWIKRPDARFLPKPGELRAMALDAGVKLYTAASRAKTVMRRLDENRVFVPKETAAERAAAVQEMLKGLRAKSAGNAQQDSGEHPKADENGEAGH
jgi:hypothetical protein